MNITPDEASEDLDALRQRAQDMNMEEAKELALESIRQNIDEGGRPDPFEPRVHSKYDDGHPLLRKTDAMYRGIRASVGHNQVEITDDVDYAEYIDQGTSRMVARPFMDVIDEDLDRIEEILARNLFEDF